MPEEQSTRDRVRALVREVLQNAAPAEEVEGAKDAPTHSPDDAPAGGQQARARVVNVAPESSATPEREYARDESSKSVITETDVRGLPEGARLRVAESARLTPLAADIVRERRIELVRRPPPPRGGSGSRKNSRRRRRPRRLRAQGRAERFPRRTRPPRPRLRYELPRRRRLPGLRARRRARRRPRRGR